MLHFKNITKRQLKCFKRTSDGGYDYTDLLMCPNGQKKKLKIHLSAETGNRLIPNMASLEKLEHWIEDDFDIKAPNWKELKLQEFHNQLWQLVDAHSVPFVREGKLLKTGIEDIDCRQTPELVFFDCLTQSKDSLRPEAYMRQLRQMTQTSKSK